MIETLGDALNQGWKLRCASDAMKSIRECVYSHEVDLETIVLTRGRQFPITGLDSRLKCPRCGSRRMSIRFVVPPRAVERLRDIPALGEEDCMSRGRTSAYIENTLRANRLSSGRTAHSGARDRRRGMVTNSPHVGTTSLARRCWTEAGFLQGE
jgi:hypothetical protein